MAQKKNKKKPIIKKKNRQKNKLPKKQLEKL